MEGWVWPSAEGLGWGPTEVTAAVSEPGGDGCICHWGA